MKRKGKEREGRREEKKRKGKKKKRKENPQHNLKYRVWLRDQMAGD